MIEVCQRSFLTTILRENIEFGYFLKMYEARGGDVIYVDDYDVRRALPEVPDDNFVSRINEIVSFELSPVDTSASLDEDELRFLLKVKEQISSIYSVQEEIRYVEKLKCIKREE